MFAYFSDFQANSMGNTGALAEAGVKNIVDGRSREKKDMQVSISSLSVILPVI